MISHGVRLAVSRQYELLAIPRSNAYYKSVAMASEGDLTLKNEIDSIFTKHPHFGARTMVHELKKKGYEIARKRTSRLMEEMGLAAVYCKPDLPKPEPGHKKYPYLLRNLKIDRPDQV